MLGGRCVYVVSAPMALTAQELHDGLDNGGFGGDRYPRTKDALFNALVSLMERRKFPFRAGRKIMRQNDFISPDTTDNPEPGKWSRQTVSPVFFALQMSGYLHRDGNDYIHEPKVTPDRLNMRAYLDKNFANKIVRFGMHAVINPLNQAEIQDPRLSRHVAELLGSDTKRAEEVIRLRRLVVHHEDRSLMYWSTYFLRTDFLEAVDNLGDASLLETLFNMPDFFIPINFRIFKGRINSINAIHQVNEVIGPHIDEVMNNMREFLCVEYECINSENEVQFLARINMNPRYFNINAQNCRLMHPDALPDSTSDLRRLAFGSGNRRDDPGGV